MLKPIFPLCEEVGTGNRGEESLVGTNIRCGFFFSDVVSTATAAETIQSMDMIVIERVMDFSLVIS